jgi:hypothetical protein
VIFLLQSLITITLETQTTTVQTTGGDTALIAAPTAAAVMVVTATPIPSLPTVALVALDTATAIPTVDSNSGLPTLPPAVPVDPTATAPTNAQAATPPAVDPTAAPAEATRGGNLLRLGIMPRAEVDCLFPSTVAATIWQEALGIGVTIEEFSATDELFLALTDAAHPRHIDATLCYVDPVDRSYLRQYPGALQIVGDAFWQTADARLLAMRSSEPAAVVEEVTTCVSNYLRNQTYDTASLEGVDPTEWLATNRELATTWLDCALPTP